MTKRQCDQCRYWVVDDEEIGECRLNPPQLNPIVVFSIIKPNCDAQDKFDAACDAAQIHNAWQFPYTRFDKWCSHWRGINE